MMGHLNPSLMKQVEYVVKITQLFKALQQQFHQKHLSHVMNTYMRLLNFNMRPRMRIHDHIRWFVVRDPRYEKGASWHGESYAFSSLIAYILLHTIKIILHRDNKDVIYNEVVSALLLDEGEQGMLSSFRLFTYDDTHCDRSSITSKIYQRIKMYRIEEAKA